MSQSYLRAVQACTLDILIIAEVIFQFIEIFMYTRYYLCYTIIIFRKMFEDNVICIYIYIYTLIYRTYTKQFLVPFLIMLIIM